MLETHQKAPDFTSVDQHNNQVSLSDYAGRKNVVLYFYPRDDTPGCTIEAREFSAVAAEFAERDTAVIGVSKDDCESHRAFVDKYGLMVELLAAGLTGANFAADASSFLDAQGAPPGTGQLLLAFDPAAFGGGADRFAALAAAVEEQPGARLPGARRLALRQAVATAGLTIPDPLMSEIQAI